MDVRREWEAAGVKSSRVAAAVKPPRASGTEKSVRAPEKGRCLINQSLSRNISANRVVALT